MISRPSSPKFDLKTAQVLSLGLQRAQSGLYVFASGPRVGVMQEWDLLSSASLGVSQVVFRCV